MPRRWLPIICAAVLAVGCGSSSGSGKASPTATPTATATDTPTATATATATPTATATVHSSDLQQLPQAPEPSGNPPTLQGTSRHAFLRAVFDDAEALWHRQFQAAGLTYHPARLTIFSQQVHTACGTQPVDVGPFYCPPSFGVYLDPVFFAALSRHVGVHLGDVAQAYVVAHELGHHVQTLLGITHQKALEQPLPAVRAAGRLLRRRVDALGLPARPAHGRGPPAGPRRRHRGRRRLREERRRPGAPPRGLDARLLRAAAAVADDRLRGGQARRLRHVQPMKGATR
jgi:putative neutral zinc metallopeptidase